ncbi:glycosyltransferase [Erythrobacter rubeus]|uniref:Glycosyltransferase n=1 Tax=Erythrobacter rubeus TaxID=2760803 RepID=A0ABR8KRG4_9SPHN|nr:glycosyltransferase [Erythrobacter rubeus]MBD2841039.1 glycosyltransferase [Erythrobacter rubeus]
MMRVAILGEQNFSLIDGSTIWLLNVCKLISLQHDIEPVLVLSHPLTNDLLAKELPERVKIVRFEEISHLLAPGADRLDAASASLALGVAERLHGPLDRVFVRGARFLESLVHEPDWRQRVVAYTPETLPDLTRPEPAWLLAAREARIPLVVQSEIAKQAMEALSNYPAQVVHVVPPIVFDDAEREPRANSPVRLCYSGKIDPNYGIDWLLEFCETLPDQSDLAATIIAGKDSFRARHPEFFKKFDVFRSDVLSGFVQNVEYHSNLSHAEAKAQMSKAHFAFCLRHAKYDDVIEISTKIVEFSSLGVPPILNDTALNRSLFGEDYPYYVDILSENVVERLHEIMASVGTESYELAQARTTEIASQFSASKLSDKLGTAIRGFSDAAFVDEGSKRRILIATHERKFLNQFLDQVRGDPNIDIVWQHWKTTTQYGPQAPNVPPDVDTVFCEWACENAVWHSHNKRQGTKLIVRLHRFEAFRDFPARINWEAVDALIVVSEYFRDMMVEDHGVDPDRIHILPQYIDWDQLQRSKHPDANFTLGLVGINPFDHKRFDRAIDFFAKLRQKDPRFQLAVRSVMPWQIGWVWDADNDDKVKFENVFNRIFADPVLQGSVRFDPAGPDMEEWYRGIGTILSSSDTEGCHTSVMEALASGSDAVVYNWPGARSLFDEHVEDDMADAVDRVIAFADDPAQPEKRRAFSQSMKQYDVVKFTRDFFQL